MKTILLIDADIVAYKFSAAAEQSFDFGEDQPIKVVDDIENIKVEITEYLDNIKDHLQADSMIICLSSPSKDNWRLSVLPSYKENRKNLVRPELLPQVRQWMQDTYPHYIRDTLEADDVMGILATQKAKTKQRMIIVSEDKDMQSVPGWLYNPRKDTSPRYITKHEADRFHLYQTLIGDSTDNYKGCPGIGPVKAEKLLDEDCSWDAVVWQYHCKGLTEEDALVQARVARICRAEDYDFTKKEVRLWNPQR